MVSGQTPPSAGSDGWVPLLNGKNFDGWYTFLPSTGKNNDPKKVFKMENGMVHILDIPESDEKQEFGYLSSEREFSNCRIRVEFQWGIKRFVPNNENKRDSGLLYFFNGPDKIWPRALEFQIQETDVGDLWLLDGSRITTKVRSYSALPRSICDPSSLVKVARPALWRAHCQSGVQRNLGPNGLPLPHVSILVECSHRPSYPRWSCGNAPASRCPRLV